MAKMGQKLCRHWVNKSPVRESHTFGQQKAWTKLRGTLAGQGFTWTTEQHLHVCPAGGWLSIKAIFHSFLGHHINYPVNGLLTNVKRLLWKLTRPFTKNLEKGEKDKMTLDLTANNVSLLVQFPSIFTGRIIIDHVAKLLLKTFL